MLFNSFDFVLFFPAVVAAFFALPYRYRWGLLLVASYYFYACWKVEYLLLLVASTLVAYWTALRMDRLETKAQRKPYLILSLVANLGILVGFKYLDFFNESVRALFQQFNIFYDVPAFNILLPVGISFYTFQTLSYSVDVYRGTVRAERHLGIFALFVSFFPQLVAGPIEKSRRLLPQFRERQDFDAGRATEGLKLVLWGFFKKLVIADRLGMYVFLVYNNPGEYGGWPLIVATLFFGIQLYCDFSGYTDIAIGTARVMGFDLVTNFRQPYFSRSIQEFWQRWHISLMSWFRDYVYVPLRGERADRGSAADRYRGLAAVFIVFLLNGLWHGANWTYVAFGAIHGLYLVLADLTKNMRNRGWGLVERAVQPRLVGQYRAAGLAPGLNLQAVRGVVALVSTLTLVHFAAIFFRAQSIGDAVGFVGDLFDFSGAQNLVLAGFGAGEFVLALASLALLFFVEHLEYKHRVPVWGLLSERPRWLRWGAYYALVGFILVFGKFGAQQFIYFQF